MPNDKDCMRSLKNFVYNHVEHSHFG